MTKTRDSLSLQELHFVQRHPGYPGDNNELTVKKYETKYWTIFVGEKNHISNYNDGLKSIYK